MRLSGPERPLPISSLLDAAGAEAVRARTMLIEGAQGEKRDPIYGTYQRTKDVLDAVVAGVGFLHRIFGGGLTLPNGEIIQINPTYSELDIGLDRKTRGVTKVEQKDLEELALRMAELAKAGENAALVTDTGRREVILDNSDVYPVFHD